MRKYIVNLTTNLIGMNKLDAWAKSWKFDKADLPASLYGILMHNVSKMSPETLGKIMCSFEPSDIRYELPYPIKLPYDCEEILRETVGWFLSYAIADRLDADPDRNTTVPVYLTPAQKDPRLKE